METWMDKRLRETCLAVKGQGKEEWGGGQDVVINSDALRREEGPEQREGGRVLCNMDGETRL